MQFKEVGNSENSRSPKAKLSSSSSTEHSSHSGRYDWVVEQLISHDYHVVYGDLPGQGENIPTKRGHIRSFQQYLDTVKTWVNHAKSYELPIFLFGHSMGGLISIRFVQTMNIPLDGVILSFLLQSGLLLDRIRYCVRSPV